MYPDAIKIYRDRIYLHLWSDRGFQQVTVLEAEVSLTGKEWQNHPVVTGPETPFILGIVYFTIRYFKDPKRYCWAFGTTAVQTEETRPCLVSKKTFLLWDC